MKTDTIFFQSSFCAKAGNHRSVESSSQLLLDWLKNFLNPPPPEDVAMKQAATIARLQVGFRELPE